MEVQRESIFVSALRGFCRSLFILLGVFVAIFIAILMFSAFSSTYQAEEKTRLEILPDLNWKKELVSLTAPVVLQINIDNIIGDPQHLNSEIIFNILVDSRGGILQDRVKAILLRINTPGGAVFDSDDIYRLLLQYKEKFKVPVFAYVDGLCASGGMYIASAADRIYCSPEGIVGSVGVRAGPFFNVFDAMTKFGIQAKTLTEGLDKDMMSPTRPWKPDESKNLQDLIAVSYRQFVDIVTAARPRLDRNKLINEYGAKIFDGVTAQEYGYIDVANSSYDATLSALLEEAKIDLNKPYQVVQLLPQHSLLNLLLSGQSPLFSGFLEHRLNIGSEKSYVIKDPFAYLYCE